MDKKVIGFILANWEGEKIALDLYEGNMIISPDGKKMKIDASVYNSMRRLIKGPLPMINRSVLPITGTGIIR